MKEMEKGYVRVYTGNGQGKTTAAFGLVLRALCSGKTAYIGQFVKNEPYNEAHITRFCKRVTVEQLGTGCFIEREPEKIDVEAAQAALQHVAQIMANGVYDLVVLDELCIALHYGLIPVQDVIAAIRARDEKTEVVITGRYAPQELIDEAHLVTDMREVKHYYQAGVLSRDGFDH